MNQRRGEEKNGGREGERAPACLEGERARLPAFLRAFPCHFFQSQSSLLHHAVAFADLRARAHTHTHTHTLTHTHTHTQEITTDYGCRWSLGNHTSFQSLTNRVRRPFHPVRALETPYPCLSFLKCSERRC